MFQFLAPGNLHNKLKGLFVSTAAEQRVKADAMKNSFLSSKTVDDDTTTTGEKLGNEVLRELITNHKEVPAEKPFRNDALIGRLFKASLQSLSKNRKTSDTTTPDGYNKVLNEKISNDALIGRLFKESVLSEYHRISGKTTTAPSDYKEKINDQESILSSTNEHHSTSETTTNDYKENNDNDQIRDSPRRMSNDYNNVNILMKSLFDSVINQQEQQDDSRTTTEIVHHKDIKTTSDKLHHGHIAPDDASSYDDGRNDPKDKHVTAINSDNIDLASGVKENQNENFVVNRNDVSPTPTIENLRRLKDDLNELYKLVIEERQLKHTK